MGDVVRGAFGRLTFSLDQRRMVVELRTRGVSWERIAERLGCSTYRARREGVALGLPASPQRQEIATPLERRNVLGGEPLPPWSDISRAVLAEAGLPVPAPGKIWL